MIVLYILYFTRLPSFLLTLAFSRFLDDSTSYSSLWKSILPPPPALTLKAIQVHSLRAKLNNTQRHEKYIKQNIYDVISLVSVSFVRKYCQHSSILFGRNKFPSGLRFNFSHESLFTARTSILQNIYWIGDV